ncbi:hypothetical protein EVAR_41460_1 [Eumeta japonica]|uniref:Uncharacterized protein n=1 Tax=Eumeta variegata TaxID=151549 RepID=A0A4C1X3A1_EUMVA|nr:hypothetical protein EVAR_41460_1 [Eumeta japonica]
MEERSLVPRSRSHARLRRNVTMSYAFSYVQRRSSIYKTLSRHKYQERLDQYIDQLATEVHGVGSLRYFCLKRNSIADLAIRFTDRKLKWHQWIHNSAKDIYTNESQISN